MSTTWYVIDTRTNQIINAITTSGAKPEIDPKRWESAEHLRLDDNPPPRTCARCGWLTSDRLCPNCGADPDAAVV